MGEKEELLRENRQLRKDKGTLEVRLREAQQQLLDTADVMDKARKLRDASTFIPTAGFKANERLKEAREAFDQALEKAQGKRESE
jgi:hypothetical protein